LQPPPETNASALPGATRLYPHQRAIVDAIGDPEKAGAFLCGVAFFRAKFDAGRSMLFVQL
jgi:hypothetical protein